MVDSLTAAPELENSFSGSHVRGITHEGSHAWALLAAAPSAAPSRACVFSCRREAASACANACSRLLHPCVPRFTKCASRTRPCKRLMPLMPGIGKVGWCRAISSNPHCAPQAKQSRASARSFPQARARFNAACPPPQTKSRWYFTACSSRAGRGKAHFSAWEIPRKSSAPRMREPLSACCINSICIATRWPPTPITLCIAAPRKDGLNPPCSTIPRNSTRCSTLAILIRKFPRWQPVIEVCSTH